MTDIQPDEREVIQAEGEAGASVPVCVTEVKAPVRVQVLPRKGGSTFTKTLSTTPQRILTADHRRARAVVVAGDGVTPFLVAFSSAAAQDASRMTLWPGLLPFEHDATTEVWAMVSTGTLAVGVATWLWAEGE